MSNPTRTVHLWLANDEGLYLGAKEAAQGETGGSRFVTDAVREFVEDVVGLSDAGGLLADLLGDVLDDVDWDEIASEYAPEEDEDDE